MMATFPTLLRAYMARGGWSQGKLARAIICSESQISRLCAAERFPSRLMVGEIAEALRLMPAESDALFVAAGFVPVDLPQSAIVAALTAAREAA